MADQQGGRRRTAGRAASSDSRRRLAVDRDAQRKRARPPGLKEGRELPETTRSTLRMEPKEKMVGVAAAVVLAIIAALFITVHPAHGLPQPDSAGPVAALVCLAVLVVSFVLGNRIVSGLLAIVAAFLLQTPHVAHSLVYLRKGALVVAVVYALWLTLQQRHAQIDNRLRKVADRHIDGAG